MSDFPGSGPRNPITDGEDPCHSHRTLGPCAACVGAPVHAFLWIGQDATYQSADGLWYRMLPGVTVRTFQRCWPHRPTRPLRGQVQCWSPLEPSREVLTG